MKVRISKGNSARTTESLHRHGWIPLPEFQPSDVDVEILGEVLVIGLVLEPRLIGPALAQAQADTPRDPFLVLLIGSLADRTSDSNQNRRKCLEARTRFHKEWPSNPEWIAAMYGLGRIDN